MASDTLSDCKSKIKVRDYHGMSNTREYQAWRNMLTRCYNPKSDHFPNYGGRGIRVCEGWRTSFRSFYEDMGECPADYTLERSNTDGDYGPDNPCYWAPIDDQVRNKTTNHYIEYAGESMILEDWAKKLGIKRLTILMRLKRGWSVGEALGFEQHKDQRCNSNTRPLEYNGQTMSVAEWARVRGIHVGALRSRLTNAYWTVGQALGFEPPPQRIGDPNSPGAQRQRLHRERKKQGG